MGTLHCKWQVLGSRVRHRRAQNSASFLFCPSGNGLVLSYGGHPAWAVCIPCPMPPCRHAHANRAHLSAPRAPVCIHAHTQPRPQAAGDAVHERTHSLWHSLGHQEHLTAALVRTPRGRSCFANRGCNGSPQTEKQILLRAVCMACEVSIETKEKKAAHFAVFVSRYSLLLMTENCSAPTKTRAALHGWEQGRGPSAQRCCPREGTQPLRPAAARVVRGGKAGERNRQMALLYTKRQRGKM